MKNGISRVAIEHLERYGGDEIEMGLRNLFDNLGGLQSLIPPHTRRVLVKPNIVFANSWETGQTTNLVLLEKLVGMIRALGLNVVVGEGPGMPDALEKIGLTEICRRLGVPLYDFKKGEPVTVAIPDGTAIKSIIVDKALLKCDFHISLAKMKTHTEVTASLSLKNMKGLLLTDKERLKFHLQDVHTCLADIVRVFRPHLAIVEGLIGLQGMGPGKPGHPIDLGLLVGGTDPLAVDAVCVAKIMRHDPRKIKYLRLAWEHGCGNIDMEKIEILGADPDQVAPDKYEMPPTSVEGMSPDKKIEIAAGGPCSNCIAVLAACLNCYLDRKKIEAGTHSVRILLGARAQMKATGNEIAVGNCLKRYKGKIPFIPGCPPPGDTVLPDVIARGLQGNFSADISDLTERFDSKLF